MESFFPIVIEYVEGPHTGYNLLIALPQVLPVGVAFKIVCTKVHETPPEG